MQRIANASDPLKLHYSAIAYKPFLSLFNMTGVVADGALPPSIGMRSISATAHSLVLTSAHSELRRVRHIGGSAASTVFGAFRSLQLQERHRRRQLPNVLDALPGLGWLRGHGRAPVDVRQRIPASRDQHHP